MSPNKPQCRGTEIHPRVPEGFSLVDAWDHLTETPAHREEWRLLMRMDDDDLQRALRKMFPGVTG